MKGDNAANCRWAELTAWPHHFGQLCGSPTMLGTVPDPHTKVNPMLPTIIEALIKIGLIIGGLMTGAAYLVLTERWIAAWVQDRLGPNRVGIPLTKVRLFGLGQPLADGMKFFFKAEFTPDHVDKALYFLAPVVMFVTAIAVYAVIPFGSLLPPERCRQLGRGAAGRA